MPEGWSHDGLTDEQIAANMGITRKTSYNWKSQHLSILHALKKGRGSRSNIEKRPQKATDLDILEPLKRRVVGGLEAIFYQQN